MKTIIALLTTAVLLLAFAAQAEAMSDRGIAKKALAAQSVSYKKFAKAKFSNAFITSFSTEATCVQGLLDGIQGSSMSEDDKDGYAFTTVVLYIFDYTVAASKDRQQLSAKQAQFLQKKSKELKNRSKARDGRVIARSLAGHAGLVRYFVRGVDLDFCAVQTAVEGAGGYTAANLENAYNASLSDEYITWIENDGGASDLVSKGQNAMFEVRPKLNPKRISSYGDPVSFGLMDAESPMPTSLLSPTSLHNIDVRAAVRSAAG